MLRHAAAGRVDPVEIRIALDTVEPPAGRVRVIPADDRSPSGQAEGIPFVGWLGLLRALDELMASADDAAPRDAAQ